MLPWWAWRGLLEVEGGVGGGELVPAATAAGTATTAVAASPQRQRSTFLDLGEPMVPGLARHARRRERERSCCRAQKSIRDIMRPADKRDGRRQALVLQ
jgi:hypothetical protein